MINTNRLKEIVQNQAEQVSNIPIDDSYEDAIDLLYDYIHLDYEFRISRPATCIVSGMGKAGLIGANIAAKLSSTGTPAIFVHPAEAQHGDLGMIQPEAPMIFLSNSGKTREVLEMISLTKKLHPDSRVPIISITGDKDSELAKLSDIVLWTGDSVEICPLGLCPTTSTTLMTVIGDLLVVGLMDKIGFTKEEYAKRHHGGYLGEKSRI